MSKQVAVIVLLSVFIFLGFIFVLNKREVSVETMQNQVNEQSPTTTQNQDIDKQASFAIFTNGTFRVFTASMYHNLSEDVYIQNDNPNLIHVKKSSITWDDFFKTLPFSLTKGCLITGTKETFCTGSKGELKFYLNGERNESVLDQEIQNGDKIEVRFE